MLTANPNINNLTHKLLFRNNRRSFPADGSPTGLAIPSPFRWRNACAKCEGSFLRLVRVACQIHFTKGDALFLCSLFPDFTQLEFSSNESFITKRKG
jgi:hypothetical protein